MGICVIVLTMFDARYFLFETLASMYVHDDEPSCITSIIYNNGFGGRGLHNIYVSDSIQRQRELILAR